MKNLNAATLLLCVCLFFPFTISAQTASDTATYKMTLQKADSLLIALSKEKSKQKISGQDTTLNVFDSLLTDTLPATDSDTTTFSLPEWETVREHAKVTTDSVADTSTFSLSGLSSVADTVPVVGTKEPERHRKKARIDRSDLLIEQETGQDILKGDEVEIAFGNRRSVNEGTLIGMGGYKLRDRYLSQVDYGGLGFRFMNERMRLLKSANSKVSRQNMVNVDVSSALNGAENANFLSAFVDYSIGYHYRFSPDPYFKIMLGGSARGLLGMVYNTRNGNNPMTVHADVDLNFSLIAIYEFRVKRRPLALRYQFETPFVGVLFSPVYDQSYYEIFTLGNTAEIFNINSFHNKFAMRNHLMLDFPIGNMTVRAGYLGTYYATNVHQIDRYIISHNFMIGFVKEFIAFGGREMRKRNLYRSAYY